MTVSRQPKQISLDSTNSNKLNSSRSHFQSNQNSTPALLCQFHGIKSIQTKRRVEQSTKCTIVPWQFHSSFPQNMSQTPNQYPSLMLHQSLFHHQTDRSTKRRRRRANKRKEPLGACQEGSFLELCKKQCVCIVMAKGQRTHVTSSSATDWLKLIPSKNVQCLINVCSKILLASNDVTKYLLTSKKYF